MKPATMTLPVPTGTLDRKLGPPMTGHDAGTLPVDAYWVFLARYGIEPQQIQVWGGAVLAGPEPETPQP